jgi:hypothetical protein
MVPDRRRWLIPVIAALYVIPFPYFPAIHSPNEGSRLYQVRSLVDDHSFAVDNALRRYGPIGDLAHSDTGYYPNKAPGVSIFGAAVYWVAKLFVGERLDNGALLYLVRVFCCGLPTVVLLVFMRRRMWRWAHDPDAADVALISYALGSLAYTYGLLFFSHQLAAVCLAGSFLCLEANRERPRFWLCILGGFLAGYAVLSEYTSAVAALPLGIYVLVASRHRWRSVLAFGLASVPPQLLLLRYHQIAYGSPFRVGYQSNVSHQFQQWHAQGFMGVTTPTWLGLVGSYFSPAKGLLIFSPFLALGFVGLWVLSRRSETRAPARLLGVLLVLYTAFTASFIYEAWGWTVGPRHIAPLAAFLAFPAAAGLAAARAKGTAWGGVALGLCLLSVVMTSLSTVTYPHFPEVFSNGFLEVTLPLLFGGYLPRNLFGASGGDWTLGWLLYFVGWGGLLGFQLVRGVARASGRAIAVATFCVGVLTLWLVSNAPHPQKEAALKFIQQSYRAE